MKRIQLLPALLLLGLGLPLPAQSLPEAEQLLQSRDYLPAAEKLSALPVEARADGYAEWLRAVALLQAGKSAEAVSAAGAVPAGSKWYRKALLLKARALTDLKKFTEAESLYAEAAARALAPARKDELAACLTAFADELAREPAPGEIDAPEPDTARAVKLYQQALAVDFLTPVFTEANLFKLAVSLQKLGEPQNALIALDDYLTQFDQSWRPLFDSGHQDDRKPAGARGEAGPRVAKPRDAKRFLQAGQHLHEARLRVAENQLALRRITAARKTASDLLEMKPAPDAAIQAAAAWLKCRTFGKLEPLAGASANDSASNQTQTNAQIKNFNDSTGRNAIDSLVRNAIDSNTYSVPDRGLSGDPAKHNEALRAFLTAWPADAKAPDAAHLIGENLLLLGKTQDGIPALRDFIEGKGYQFDPAAETNRKPDPATGLNAVERLDRKKQAAFFRIAQLEFDRKQFAEAITQWRAYTVNYPNGAQWAGAQQGIIDAEFSLGIAAVAAADEALARERFDAFLSRYPLDGRSRQILFIHGQFAYAAAQMQELEARGKNANAALPAATLDLFRAAIDQWSRLITKYPQSEEASLALYNTALILTEKLDRPEEALAAFRRLTWGQWAQAAKERAGILEEKSLAISAPRVFRTNKVPQLSVSVRNIKKLKVSRYSLDLEGWLRSAHRLGGLDKLDVDLIAPEKTWEVDVAGFAPWRGLQQQIELPFPDEQAGACVVRVEGDDWQATTLVVRSDIELITQATRSEVLVLAMNARAGQPAANAPVLISDGTKIIATGTTGADGVFRHRTEKLPDTVRAFVLAAHGGAMVSGLDLASLTTVRQPAASTGTTFDRQSYLPGQTAKFLILRHLIDGPKLSPAQGKVTVRVLDPDDRLVLARPAEWAPDGTIHSSFHIPPAAPEGEYKVQILDPEEKIIVRAPFGVEAPPEDSSPQLSLKLDRGVVMPGGMINATLMVDWPWGLPLMDEVVEITFPDGKSERRKTDPAGVLSFAFNATPGTDVPFRTENLTLTLPQQEESTALQASYSVTTQEWSLIPREAPGVVAAGAEWPLQVRALSYLEKPVAKEIKVTLSRLTAPPPSRVLEGVPWISYSAPAVGEEKTGEFTLISSPETGYADHTLKLPEAGGHYVLRYLGEAGKVSAEQRFFVSGGTDPHGLRILTGTGNVEEGSTQTYRLLSRQAHDHVLVTVSGDYFLSHQVLAIPSGISGLPLLITAEHAPNFRLTATTLDGQNLLAASTACTVRRGLRIAMKPPANPGAAPAIEVTDLAGKPVSASVLAALVRTSPDPDALTGPRERAGTIPVVSISEMRDLRLAVHTSAALMFPGTSLKVSAATGASPETKLMVFNDQQRIIKVQEMEGTSNGSNTLLISNNFSFAAANCFVQLSAPAGRSSGPLIFAEGVRRKIDGFVQSSNLHAIPDAINADGLLLPPEPMPGMPAIPQARLFTQAAAGAQPYDPFDPSRMDDDPTQIPQRADNFAAANAFVASEAWSVGTGQPNFQMKDLEDGRWQAIVRAWTPEHGMVEASLPLVQRHPLGVKVVRTEAPAALLIVTNRDHLAGQVIVSGSGRTQCRTELQLDPSLIREVFPLGTEVSRGQTGVRVESPASAILGTWSDVTMGWKTAAPNLQPPVLTTTAGGVITATDEIDLQVSGVRAGPMEFAGAAIFRTPTELVMSLGDRPVLEGVPAEHLPAAELLARVTLMERLKKGTPEQKAKAETLLERSVDLVSALALEEQNGGWAWGGLAINPDILSTAQTWWAMQAAKRAGVVVSDKLKARVESFLAANYAGIPADDYDKKAAVLHAMSAVGIADYANAAPMLRVRDKLSDCALAFLTAALIRMERADDALPLLQLLESRAVRGKWGTTLETASWKGSGKIVRLSETELITAMVLWCEAKLQPSSATGAAAANWLLGSRVMAPQGGTLSLGPVTVALDAWFSGPNDWTEPGYLQFVHNGTIVDQTNDPLTVDLAGREGSNPLKLQPRDGKKVIFSATLGGKAKEPTDPKPWAHPEIASRKYLHRTLRHGDSALNAPSTSPVQTAVTGQRLQVEVKLKSSEADAAGHPQYLVWDEPLPACFGLVPGSLEGNWNRLEFLPGLIRLTYAPGVVETLRYQLTALVPGTSTVAASIIRDAYDPAQYRPGVPAVLTVLPPGALSPDVYEMNQAEHFELAKRTFDGSNSAECLKHLDALAPSARKTEFEKDLARMRLWLLTDTPDGDAAQIVQAFETLNERHPGLVVPFDRIRRVGAAYQKISEHERGAYVFSAALEANFLTDSAISAVLEDQGDYAGSVDFQERLWQEAPDTEDPRAALFALSQSLFSKSGNADRLPVRQGQKKLEKNALLARSRDLLTRFITLYPAEALADDAAFSLANANFALKDYPAVASAAEAASRRHPQSPFLGQFQYMAALGHFWQFHYAEALASAAPVANGMGKDRDLARYITGQIYHAEGKPAEAVDWYRKVKSKYPDAADSLAAFEQKKITVPEIATWPPGSPVRLNVTHRNVTAASLQIYKVDLMKLYLREKNLSRVTSVNLAGIAPEASVPLDVANAAAWTDHEAGVALPMKEEGAYLIIARGDDLFTSGLVLITALKLDVREDAGTGSVRVNVLSATDGKYIADAEVKAIASNSPELKTGQTDPRGIFEATGLSGLATVIVRQGDNRYAFHRGTVMLAGSAPATPSTASPVNRRVILGSEFDSPQIPQTFGGKVLGKEAYFENLTDLNDTIQSGNLSTWDAKRRANGKGVQADKALKK